MHSQINEQSKKSPLKKSHELKTTIIKILIQKKKKKSIKIIFFQADKLLSMRGTPQIPAKLV